MINVAIMADLQLGNHRRFGGATVGSINERCRMIIDVLNAAVDRTDEERCTHLVVCGDLFDYVRPEAPLIAEVQKSFARISEGTDIVLLRGNHDMASTLEGDSALAPLAPYARIVDKPERIALGAVAELLAVPFQPGSVKDWLPGAIHALLLSKELAAASAAPPAGPARLLALHMGIKDEKTPPWLSSSTGAIDAAELMQLCEQFHIDAAVSGDWHSRREWKGTGMPGAKPRLLQVGALVPTGWDNPGLTGYGTLAFWRPGEVKALTYEELPGPRFIKVRTQEERDEALKAAKRCILYVSQIADPDDLTKEAQFWDAARLRSDIRLGGAEVLPDESAAKAEARHAASLASSTETVQEALDVYVKAMPLKDGVRRDAVLERARSYLK